MKKYISTLLFSAIIGFSTNANACLSCGCGSSGVSGDLGALGGTSSIFSKGSKFMVQLGTSYRNVTGSFNESGKWSSMPIDGNISSVQSSLGLMYMPIQDLSIGIQAPLNINFLSKASWGSFGSISPTDLSPTSGISMGDMNVQGTYKFFEHDDLAFAGWLGLSLPTGNAQGNPENLSGSGVVSGSAGILALKQWNNFEVFANLGYQHPFSSPINTNTVFYIGNSLMYQVQGNYKITDNIRIGLGLSGYTGQLLFNSQSMGVGSLRIIPSVQYDFDVYRGIRAAYGYNPGLFSSNSLSDSTFYLVFYNFIQ